ncbi:MAG: PAS domain S-box protein, partial [Myxococcaceae bacterium]
MEAETERPERERILASVLDTVPVMVLVFDDRGEITFMNRACSEAAGGCRLLLARENGDARAAIEKMRSGQLPLPFESSWVLPDGTTRVVEWTYQRFKHGESGQSIACTGVDVTDRQRTQQALHTQVHLLQTLMDTIPNPLFYKTVDGLYRGCNRAFEEMLGIPRERLVGKSVYELSPKELADIYFEKDQELFQHPGVQVYEASVRYASGQLREVIYYKATYNDSEGQLAGLVGIFLDISDRKRAERELQRTRDELETRVKERTAEL